MDETINVFTDADPHLSYVLVQLVTKSGHYLDLSQARYLIGGGKVKVDGATQTNSMTVIPAGLHHVSIRENTYRVQLLHSIKE